MEFRFGQSIIYDTAKQDEDGRVILTKIPPRGRASISVGAKTYMPLREAAVRLGIHEQRLRELVWDGEIPAVKIGGRVLIEGKWVAVQERLMQE